MKPELINQFTVKRDKRKPFFKMEDAHYHPIWEIYYLYSGERRFFINDSIYHVHRGDLVLIEKGAIHRTSYGSDKSHERMFIYLPDDYLEELYELYGKEQIRACFSYPLLSVPQTQRQDIEMLFRKIEKEYNHHDEYSELLIKGYINDLIVFILRYQEYSRDIEFTVLDKIDERIQQVTRYIRGHYHKPITLAEMARIANMSPSYFSKHFKESTCFGFKEYVLNVRFRRAIELLLETRLSITEVAYQCGFNDSNYFGDMFKKYKGLSPLQYRKNNEWI